MANILIRAKGIYQRQGTASLLKATVLYCRHRLYSRSSYSIMESCLDPPDRKSKSNDLVIKMITELGDFDEIVKAGEFDVERNREILGMGALFFCAFIGKELVHITQVFLSHEAHQAHPLLWFYTIR